MLIGFGSTWEAAVKMAMLQAPTTPPSALPAKLDAVTDGAIASVKNALPSMPEVLYADPKIMPHVVEHSASRERAVGSVESAEPSPGLGTPGNDPG